MTSKLLWDDNDLEELRKRVKYQLNIKNEQELNEQIKTTFQSEKKTISTSTYHNHEQKVVNTKTPSVKIPTTNKQKSQTVIKRNTKTPLQNVKRIQNYSVQTKKESFEYEPRRSSVAPNFAMLHRKEQERIQKFRQNNKRTCTTPSNVSLSTQKRDLERKKNEEFQDGDEFFEIEKTPKKKEKIKKMLQEEEEEENGGKNKENIIIVDKEKFIEDEKHFNETPSRSRSILKYQSPSTSGFIHGFTEICKTPSGKFNNILTNYGLNKQPVQRKIKFDKEEEEILSLSNSNTITTTPTTTELISFSNENDNNYEPSDFVKNLLIYEQLK